MLNRRRFLQTTGLALLSPACTTRPDEAGVLVNDIHSQLNPTRVATVVRPASLEDLRKVVRAARRSICVAGGRHAMGGQQFASGATLVDMNGMRRILSFDRERGIVEVEGGTQWPELVRYLIDSQKGAARSWGIRQKQTGADRLSVGGALAANVHGRGLRMKPIVADVQSFTLVGPDGGVIECSREQNSDLFALAIGGYGLFGIIASVRLRLAPRQKLQRVVELQQTDAVIDAFARRIAEGYTYGDFQFSIDERSPDFLRKGVFSCYRPVSDDTPISTAQKELQPEDWRRLLLLAHADKQRVFDEYAAYYLATSGQVYWSDDHQLSVYLDDYHRDLDLLLRSPVPATEIISEVYVPRPRLAEFMAATAEDFRRHNVNVIYGTVRLIERDDETFLPWARQDYACIVFNLHTPHSPEGEAHVAEAFRRLIDLALAREGNYFLTYHRYARRDQVEAGYPQFAEFLRRKRAHDPAERLQSDWYRHYWQMFAT